MNMQRIETIKQRSFEVILGNQHSSGAFPASPDFSQYGYSWFRDGVFISYGLLQSGNSQSAARFIQWASDAVKRVRYKIEFLYQRKANGESLEGLSKDYFLPARYTLDGWEDTSSWPNFQIDGYGSLLWLMGKYLDHEGLKELPVIWVEAAELIVSYLELVWPLPNSDCWEEFPDQIHPASLASLYGGLTTYAEKSGKSEIGDTAEKIKEFIIGSAHPEGRFQKYIGSDDVDASLLWLSVPFKLVEPGDQLMKGTVKAIERQILGKGGGVKRYKNDTYYGGGEWIILSAFLGWYYCTIGRRKDAEHLLNWIVEQADEVGNLPEQVLDNANDPSMISVWEKRWGRVANPLLWSHAMYLILIDLLGQQ